MKFLYPEILYALVAIAIPIIVHLFNFRKFKKVAFSNVGFLKEIKQETQSKSKLKHILILISRILAITFIVFAFAQPFIPIEKDSNASSGHVVSIFLDNSFSMQGNSSEGPMLEVARNKALEIVDQYAQTDKFQIITQDFEGRHQRLVNKEEMIELIGEINISAQSHDLSEIISRQKDAILQADGDKFAYVISDFQSSTTNFNACKADTSFQVILIPSIREDKSNLYIDSLWFDTPVRQINAAEKLWYRVSNSGDELSENVPAELRINGVQRAVGVTTVGEAPADSSLSYTNIEGSWKAGWVEISDYPVTFDDRFYFSYEVSEQISVREIKGAGVIRDYVENLFTDDPFFDFESNREGDFTYESLNSTDLVILNQLDEISSGLVSELEKFISNGGCVFVIPSEKSNIQSYNGLLSRLSTDKIQAKKSLSTRVSSLNTDHFIYRGVFEKLPKNIDLPSVNSYYPILSSSRSNSTDLLQLKTGDAFLKEYEFGQGRFYLLSSSLSQSDGNLPQHAIFVTTALRIAEFAKASTRIFFTIGKDESVELRNIDVSADEVFKLKKSNSEAEFIPEHRTIGGSTRIYLENAIQESGHYWLSLGNDSLALLSFNYPRQESVLQSKSTEELTDDISNFALNYKVVDNNLESMSQAIDDLTEGRQLWRTMIIWALIFLAIEILLIKFWKRA